MESLRPVEFHVLLALAPGPSHGYALVGRIAEESEGRYRVLPGNLYAVIRRLADDGLVRESARPPADGEDSRRRYFELTPSGRSLLAREARHMEHLVERLRGLQHASEETSHS